MSSSDGPPHVSTPDRRQVLAAIGLATVGVSSVGSKALAQPALSKKLTLGYIPITCAVPLLAAQAFGFFEREGLDVTLVRTPSWALVRDKLVNGEYDVAQMVLPMPLGISAGVGSVATPIKIVAIDNLNGSGLVLHAKHSGRRDPRQWGGFKFGVPFEHSIHNLLLRYYLAEFGLDPDRDVSIRVYPPADSVANLESGNLDGMLFAEPWGQRAVYEGAGFYHLLSKDLMPGHACCAVAITEKFAVEQPATYAAVSRAAVRSIDFVAKMENRQKVAEVLSGPNYLNQPKTVLEQVLLGRFADGLGQVNSVPDRIDFKPYPSAQTGLWLVTQMKRWGYIPTGLDDKALVTRVFAEAEAEARMSDAGVKIPTDRNAPISVMGRTFDSSKPDAYLQGFKIRRAD